MLLFAHYSYLNFFQIGVSTKYLNVKEWLTHVQKSINDYIFLTREKENKYKKLIQIITLLENYIENRDNQTIISFSIQNFESFVISNLLVKICYNLRGLDLKEISAFAEISLIENDDNFYSKFKDLSEGSYYIQFKVLDTNHVLGYQKFSDETGFLFDPNFGLKSLDDNNQNHVELLKNCIQFYSNLKNHYIKIYEVCRLD